MNLLQNTQSRTITNHQTLRFDLNDEFKKEIESHRGEVTTISFDYEVTSGQETLNSLITQFACYNPGLGFYAVGNFVNLRENPKGRYITHFTIPGQIIYNSNTFFQVRTDSTDTGVVNISGVKMEMGWVSNPIWTPAPEDTLAAIEALAARVAALEGKT